jgi:hypothetical protein
VNRGQRRAATSRANNSKRQRFYTEQREERNESRSWYCRTCGLEEIGLHVPQGWYRLERKGTQSPPWARLGLFCSIECIAQMLIRLNGIERDLGESWDQFVGLDGQYQPRV